MKKLLILGGFSIFGLTACKHTQKTASSSGKLVTVMAAPPTTKAGNPVTLTFTVQNSSSRELRFCKWQTPFEGFLSPYLDITDAKGTEVMYKGAMAKRIMPPPEEAYLKVPAGGKVSVSVNLLDGYELTAPGTYKAHYQSGGVSGLETVNDVTFTLN